MKADSSGTLAEQARYRVGWKSPAERKQKTEEHVPSLPASWTCSTCRFYTDSGTRVKRCHVGGFSTSATAACHQYHRKLFQP